MTINGLRQLLKGTAPDADVYCVVSGEEGETYEIIGCMESNPVVNPRDRTTTPVVRLSLKRKRKKK